MTTIASDLQGLDGLAQMQAILSGHLHAPIGKTLDFDLIAIERGRVEFEGRISRAVYNPIGTVHGGYAATLLDTACGGAAHSSLEAGQGFTTLELKVAYHHPLTEASSPVRCEGKLVSLGRRVAYTEGRLTDAQGRLCATATSTLLIFDLDRAAAR
jgi:uncharacterized protein (TIGR00369 family)